jgi:hypothetical protein
VDEQLVMDVIGFTAPKAMANTRRKLVHYNRPLRLGHCDSWQEKCKNKSFWLSMVQKLQPKTFG